MVPEKSIDHGLLLYGHLLHVCHFARLLHRGRRFFRPTHQQQNFSPVHPQMVIIRRHVDGTREI